MHHAGVAVHPHYSVVGCGSSPCFQPVLTVVVVLKQPSLIIHTSRDLLQQSVLVDYCCFHLASDAIAAYSDKRPYCHYSGQCRYSSIAALRMKAAKTRYF